MRQIQASEAKTHFNQLLDQVERGETVVITRHGRPIVRMAPEGASSSENIASVVESIRALGRRNGPITVEEILSARDEGRK